MKSPHWFDSSDDYNDQFMKPWEIKLARDVDNDEVDGEAILQVLEKHLDDFIDKYYDEIEEIYEIWYKMEQEP